ncbi:probable tubulin polyglutamylase ttll-15 [Neocloeon triangulifer]|uniref:probable tubulin polyglutamylase ttll-15 n=1 Tax=Neocloeon triangulifer TaxID=2078957 RepID=UPI00286F32BC|nr:probable tubulin polyglutamylase ttll-15 [Neocloeon triangulifer]
MRRRTPAGETRCASKSEDGDDKTKKDFATCRSQPSSSLFAVAASVIFLGSTMVAVNIYELRSLHNEQMNVLLKVRRDLQTPPDCHVADQISHDSGEKPTLLVWSPRMDLKHLKHVYNVFERLGYQTTEDNSSDWDVLWAHDYPFQALQSSLKNLRPNQRVNKLPGTGFVTTKVSLATSGGLKIPPAFRLPDDKDKFLQYAKQNPHSMFVEKNNDHRSVILKPTKEINLESKENFVQEFITNPLLISGHKFDIGVYTIITSIDPLRIYKFDGDVLFRYCEEPYEPFNASNVAQYVIGEDYLPAWKVPALQKYAGLSFGFKESFDAYLSSIGKNPDVIWNQVDKAIASVYLSREKDFANLLSRYKNRRNFFEMVRFDFIVDENLKVHLLEANMSPNLSSMHYPPNALLYEQVLHSLLALVGVSSYMHPPYQNSNEAKNMAVADRNIMTTPEVCLNCEDCGNLECQLCAHCLSKDVVADIKMAYREHLNKYSCKRIFPPKMTRQEAKLGIPKEYEGLSHKNTLLFKWFQGKCLMDDSWC